MMAGYRSTIPGAVGVLGGYMSAAAAANPDLAPGVYTSGYPASSVKPNFMMVGSLEDGTVVDQTTYDWAAIPGNSRMATEAYQLRGTIRATVGGADQASVLRCLANAYRLLDSLRDQVAADLSGVGGATEDNPTPLSPTGSWGPMTVTMTLNEHVQDMGWVVALEFSLAVINAQLYS